MILSKCFRCQDAGFVPNGIAPLSEGMHGGEVERRLNQHVSFSFHAAHGFYYMLTENECGETYSVFQL